MDKDVLGHFIGNKVGLRGLRSPAYIDHHAIKPIMLMRLAEELEIDDLYVARPYGGGTKTIPHGKVAPFFIRWVKKEAEYHFKEHRNLNIT